MVFDMEETAEVRMSRLKRTESRAPEAVAPSITDAGRYIDHVLDARGLELPELPRSCVITYSGGLVERATERHEHDSFDIGIAVPTPIHVLTPAEGRPFGMVAGRPGAPMAAVLLEELIALGFREFLVFGTAGHPADGAGAARFGQVVLPDRAYVYEGTSAHYGWDEPCVPVSPAPRELLGEQLREAGIAYVEGPSATTDALYRETPEFIGELIDLGVQAIDMELSALLSVAQFRDAQLAAVMCISDVIQLGGIWQVGMTSERLKEMEERILPVLERAAG